VNLHARPRYEGKAFRVLGVSHVINGNASNILITNGFVLHSVATPFLKDYWTNYLILLVAEEHTPLIAIKRDRNFCRSASGLWRALGSGI
jgi:hypothetical protein